MKKMLFTSWLLAISVFANAGHEGGGGDVVVLPNGEVVLADVFLDRNQPQPDNMPRRISLNPKLLLQINLYGQLLRRQMSMGIIDPHRSDVMKLVDALGVRKNDLIFYAVANQQELNTYCASGGKKAYALPSGASVNQVACTNGNSVFLVEPLFKKMSVLQQSLLLMHERMTTLTDEYGGKNYSAIAGVTSGLGEIITKAYDQQHGNYRAITAAEQSRIRQFYEGLLELEYRKSEIPSTAMDWDIHPNGGGFVRQGGLIDSGAFLSVTSFLGPKAQVAHGTKIIDSVVQGKAHLGPQNEIIQSVITNVILTTGAKFKMHKSLIDARSPFAPIYRIVHIGNDQVMKEGVIGYDAYYYALQGMKVVLPETFRTSEVPSPCQTSLRALKKGKNDPKECFARSEFKPSFKRKYPPTYSVRFNEFVEHPMIGGRFTIHQKVDSAGWKIKAVRSYQLEFQFDKVNTPPPGGNNKRRYAVNNGKIGIAGETLVRVIYFDKHLHIGTYDWVKRMHTLILEAFNNRKGTWTKYQDGGRGGDSFIEIYFPVEPM